MLCKREARAHDIVTDALDGQTTAMAFGYGIHTCLGAPPARLESRVVMEQVLECFPALQLAPGCRHEPAPGPIMVRDRLGVAL